MNLLASPDAACLNLSAFLSVAIKPKDTSIVDTVNNWATGTMHPCEEDCRTNSRSHACLDLGLCSTAPCSNQTIAAVATNITSGCSSDITAATGSDSFSVPRLIQIVQTVYPTERKVVCLKKLVNRIYKLLALKLIIIQLGLESALSNRNTYERPKLARGSQHKQRPRCSFKCSLGDLFPLEYHLHGLCQRSVQYRQDRLSRSAITNSADPHA